MVPHLGELRKQSLKPFSLFCGSDDETQLEERAEALGRETQMAGSDSNWTGILESHLHLFLVHGLGDLKARLIEDCQLEHQQMASLFSLGFFIMWQLQGN